MAFSLLFDCNAAWTGFLTKYSEFDLTQMTSFFFLLTGTKWYYQAFHTVLKYFSSFTGYEDDILKIMSNLDIHKSKFSE